jgi:hypothetical protein
MLSAFAPLQSVHNELQLGHTHTVLIGGQSRNNTCVHACLDNKVFIAIQPTMTSQALYNKTPFSQVIGTEMDTGQETHPA